MGGDLKCDTRLCVSEIATRIKAYGPSALRRDRVMSISISTGLVLVLSLRVMHYRL